MNYFKKYNLIAGWFAFAVSAVVYLLTMEPTSSLWDCGEFIATSYKLEVGHPPGAPLFMMIARFFTIFSPDTAHVAMMVNVMSSLCSAFTILFLFWTITHLGRRIYGKTEEELSTYQTWAIVGAGLIGSIAYTFTDTFWFSAIEGEVYAMSSLFTAVVFWAILRWENVADEPHSNRWLILIAYLMGLSIGVHILNLLTIPAIVFVYYFKKYPKITAWGVVGALAVSGAILVAINGIIIPYSVLLGAWFDRMMNAMGMPVNMGMAIYALLLFAVTAWGVWYTHKRGKVVLNTIVLCFAVIMLGYSSYTSVVIRASANPPMNSNNPDNPYGLYSLLNREQYGSRPLLKGPLYSSPPVATVESSTYYVGDDGKYHKATSVTGYEYAPGFEFLFPRMWSPRADHVKGYKSWVDLKGRRIAYEGEMVTVPTFGENLHYFFSYQFNFMFVRYFMWNFVGRQSDEQSFGEITNGNWLSGVTSIDEMHLGPQSNLPDEMAHNKGRNTYYFLPFILGILGLLYHLNRDPKNFTVVLMLFVLMGAALVVYFNTNPGEPRERDYVFAGAFYAFCIWVGFGVMWLADWLSRITMRQRVATAVVATAVCACVPVILAAQNWDDHDRSNRYMARDIGWNYLQSCLPDAIIMNYGDNDTFPLWYNQEVEQVRLDVRIMNMSYLSGSWYIDEMRVRSNESNAVPFSLPRSKYLNTNEVLPVKDEFNGQTVDLRQAVDFIASESPRTKLLYVGGRSTDYLPAKKLALPVNKANVLASGIVAQKNAQMIEDTVYLTIEKNDLDKGEMMLLDLLATFDWKRPLYFSQPYNLKDFGLDQYLQFDGYAYRLVPIRTPTNPRTGMIGCIDPDYLYPLLMETFRFGNIKDPKVYCDGFVRYNLRASRVQSAYAQLAEVLTQQGDTVRAVGLLDHMIEEMPYSQTLYNVLTLPTITAYYTAGATAKGDAILRDYIENLRQYIDYYAQFRGNKAEMVSDAMQDKLWHLSMLYAVCRDYNRPDEAKLIEEIFDRYGIE